MVDYAAIEQFVQWHKSEGHTCQDIELLLAMADQAANHSYYLAEQIELLYRAWKYAEGEYKYQKAFIELNQRKLGKVGKESELKAIVDSKLYANSEADAGAKFKGLESKLRQVNKILDRINQRTSHVRKELDLTKFVKNG